MRIRIYILAIGFLGSCNLTADHESTQIPEVIHDTIRLIEKEIDTVYIEKQNDHHLTEYYMYERLPDWVLESGLLEGKVIKNEYQFDNRLNPLYLEEDFNGDGHLDIIIPVKEISSYKVGFAVIHGTTNEIFLIGAGKEIKNGLSDNMSYITI